MGKNLKRLWDKGEDINQEIHAFTVGNDPIIDLRIIPWDIIASSAHAKMLFSKDLITENELKSLLKALKDALNISEKGEFEITNELEDGHTALELFLTEKCGEAGKKIHTARSRNDQVMVAMRLLLRNALLEISKDLLDCAQVCLKRSEKTLNQQMPGYTHLQQAMPSSVGMWFNAISEAVIELLKESDYLYNLINVNPLGAASGFYTPIPIDRHLTTSLLKFESTQRNPVNIQNSRGKYEIKLARFLSDISSLIEKHSWDLIFFSLAETSFAKIPLSFTTGSSIMPQKRNPDVLELLRAQASKVRACQFELESITAKLPSNYHRDFQFTKDPLLKSFDMTKQGITIFTEVLKGVEFNSEKLEESKTAELYATYHAFRLVKSGEPFRDAYKKTADDIAKGKINISDLEKDFKIVGEILSEELEAAIKETTCIKEQLKKKEDLNLNLINEIFEI